MKLLAVLLLAAAGTIPAQTVIDLHQPDRLDLLNAKIENVMHKGQAALRVTQANPTPANAETSFSLATIRGLNMQNGEIELEMAGEPGPSAGNDARGFVGIAFRFKDARHMEVIYLRPTNGRADDQIRRNHSVQYESFPDFPWNRLREQFPKKYETYVDLEPGAWTKVRVVIDGAKARLYVHGNAQPTLIVNDLKGPNEPGAVGLWIGPGTIGHFRALKVTTR